VTLSITVQKKGKVFINGDNLKMYNKNCGNSHEDVMDLFCISFSGLFLSLEYSIPFKSG
jgi:hypothetical protein